MKILFIHQNFPGQFKYLAPALVKDGHSVFALRLDKKPILGERDLNGVRVFSYTPTKSSSSQIHSLISDFETKIIRAEATLLRAKQLKQNGFFPDLIIAHPGWGEVMFIKKVWPNAKLAVYCEYYYQSTGSDVGFDNEFTKSDTSDGCHIDMKNLVHTVQFPSIDFALSPTKWQASTFPSDFRSKIAVIHDGIDTNIVKPKAHASLCINNNLKITNHDEVLTFVNRNLEPYRGYHILMRSLPELLKKRPNLRVLLVGGDSVSYGSRPTDCKSWKEKFIAEIHPKMPSEFWSRIHFLGRIPYPIYLELLQVSTVHVYLTYPFVLSWSLLESMSAGCSIVASNTQPVAEYIRHDEHGLLVDFFDIKGLIDNIILLLDSKSKRDFLSKNARQLVIDNLDLHSICIPKQIEWINSMK